jgi:hypothetical protein
MKMQTEYQRTQEEEVFDRLLDAMRDLLSEDALELVGIARHEAYKYNLVSTYSYQPFEYFMGMEDMVRLAGELTGDEREILAEIGRAAGAAAAAIDPEDKRIAGYKVWGSNVHCYYEMVSDMIEEALEPQTDMEREDARVRLWEDYADFRRRIMQNSAQASQQASNPAPSDLDDHPF